MRKTLAVKGMHCTSCEVLLSEVSEECGAKVISANHRVGQLVVEVPSEDVLKKVRLAVQREGYQVE
ncbi:MAG: hypothetical protein HY393_04480 [Candidatus Diapherotrites archaeon]|nr:hypothetical protein [Candidatus Diapherotrites archaeon]